MKVRQNGKSGYRNYKPNLPTKVAVKVAKENGVTKPKAASNKIDDRKLAEKVVDFLTVNNIGKGTDFSSWDDDEIKGLTPALAIELGMQKKTAVRLCAKIKYLTREDKSDNES